MFLRRFYAAVFLALIFLRPAWAVILPGTTQWNPELPGQPAYYVAERPAWYTGSPIDQQNNPIFAPPAGNAFVGNVHSEVYYTNGVDASGGLAFAYQFTLAPSYTGNPLQRATFFPDYWHLVAVNRMGGDETGNSTPAPTPPSPPPGYTVWSDGDPYTILIDSATDSPVIRWLDSLGGTRMNGGQSSSILWFETAVTHWNSFGIVSLIGDDVGGGALIIVPLPEPTAGLLLMVSTGFIIFRRQRSNVEAH